MFAVRPVTVKRWADKGLLKGFKTPGNHWRFHREDVDALVARGMPKDETDPDAEVAS